jgi:hypothetical protein
MAKRTPKELWDELVDEAGEAEIEKAASMSVAQAEAELRAAGFDVDAERANARGRLDELERHDERGKAEEASATRPRLLVQEKPPTKVGPRSTRHEVWTRRRWVTAGAMAAAAGAALVLANLQGEVGSVSHSSPLDAGPTTDDRAQAGDLRRRAAAALAEGRAADCLSLLDEARAKDPAGDASPEMTKLRSDALAALGRPPPR